ncbi:hypothetical protein BC349_15125 [Flavihumibacter stibioxidans]|uniref:LemA protein n=2 Tax=Flavihumibacter stibioxidans TaxID=1834163 RepID=A0ABR7MBJ6_9BACT|nr:hypothetical protein [Flavihumibacter stibioxidans]MBC6490713.1 hypothetical protein [Flavihumibacter stibioxidans]MBC6491556.1 hypothetical protein [Flavihumibacter stibioxidans]MBC6492391.1 hypothetical protein [Flavihumibacter stibioxidans]
MDWTLVIIQGIVIAGFTSWINYLVGRWQKKLDFHYDYKKYILEKRKDAYSSIEKAFNELRNIEKNYNVADISQSNKILRRVIESTQSSIWATPELLIKLKDLQMFFAELLVFNNMSSFEEGQEMTPTDIKRFWDTFRKKHSKYQEHLNGLETVFFSDLMNLNDIDKFIKVRSTWKGFSIDPNITQ